MNTKNKIISCAKLERILPRLRRQGKKITFTNGCFDLLHFGHITYLEKAKKLNRILVVGLNSDASVKRIKGRRRPILTQRERARILAALECVDYVTIFNQDTPLSLIKRLKPDVLIKGADWKGKEVVGRDVVKEHGGRVELVHYLPKFSTTNIIETIAKKFKK